MKTKIQTADGKPIRKGQKVYGIYTSDGGKTWHANVDPRTVGEVLRDPMGGIVLHEPFIEGGPAGVGNNRWYSTPAAAASAAKKRTASATKPAKKRRAAK